MRNAKCYWIEILNAELEMSLFNQSMTFSHVQPYIKLQFNGLINFEMAGLKEPIVYFRLSK